VTAYFPVGTRFQETHMSVLDEAILMKRSPARRCLTVDTPIPTERRPYIRAFLKRQVQFHDWHMGLLEPRNVHNRELLRFAIEKGFVAQVEDLLTCPLDELKR
jgi:hypothetical protein